MGNQILVQLKDEVTTKKYVMLETAANESQHSSIKTAITKIKNCKRIQQKAKHNIYLTK